MLVLLVASLIRLYVQLDCQRKQLDITLSCMTEITDSKMNASVREKEPTLLNLVVCNDFQHSE